MKQARATKNRKMLNVVPAVKTPKAIDATPDATRSQTKNHWLPRPARPIKLHVTYNG
jgi:hypothetical protein